MEKPTSPEELSARIEAAQVRLADATSAIRQEIAPSTLVEKSKRAISEKVHDLIFDETGAPRPAAVAAAAGVALAVVGFVISKVAR